MKIHMKPMFRAAGCAVLFGALTVLAACGKEDEKAQEAAPIRPVLYTIVEPKPVAQTGFAGTVEPRYSTDLAFRVLGRVIARPVKVGDLVKKGEMVAMLDPSALDLAVQSARADLASAEAQYANASASEERQRILLRGNNVSQADYDAARQARDSAEAGLEKAQAGLRKAEDQRGYAVLRPDFDGVISATAAEVGQVVSAGQAIVTVARPDVREAVVDIPDSMTEYFKPGTPFNVQLQADPSVKGTGSVREVAPQADAQTRTRRVRIALDNPPEGFRLGATIQAARSTPETGFVSLPMPSLLEQDGKTSIWVIDPGTQTVSLHDVRVIERKGASFVAGEVEAGSYVAIAGVHELKAGQKVRLDEKGSGL
ncbi:efflux transporter, RND family, MFP subunit [Brucella sp. BO2]|uniref:efflux RND transporter periplasmic adaptor subunit n=1 Tax=Brucella sp. BO2 TaxID=693750 RepID=UPI0001E448BF|nr:efflux RND transporter periplasmic adaptor subunit [Brucella sp. BO2]EFM59721.1 efflux transporter, RND family, MFP subunit [Brucella sp. BO2]QPN27498.1 efflux RND transporter periplasmic adaptor subunit [Brucella sp. BO2]